MNTTPSFPLHSRDRALVLGGGGSTGNAWLIGVIAGLFDAGLDVTDADLTIGTSAGSTAAAQIAGATPTQLFANILDAVPPQRPAPVGSGPGRAPARPVVNHLERINKIIADAQDVADMRRRLGAAALDMDAASDGAWSTQWRTTVATRLPSQHWPERTVLITAVDARNGEPVAFDRHSGVDLVDAIAASCSSGLPYRIGDKRYLDGGYRSNAENADLAAGYGRVLVLSPFGGRSLQPLEWARISRRRSTNSAQAAAESRRSSRTATRSTCSAPMPWICRCVRPRPRRLRARQSPCRANHRVLELSRPGVADPGGVTTTVHA
ncbi:hypothetical protein AHiyo8_23610 [Arthrobacter sp. Hiyo8]|nr:hypothetical protein AHiyo8_23610 [Arthrobacter sp. Hiyo8]